MFTEQYQKLQTRTENDTGMKDDLKTLLSDLQTDRSDEAVIGDCLTALRSSGDQRIYVNFESLPPKAKPGIARLVHRR